MRKKIFTFLLALAASVGMSYALTPLAGDDWDSSTGTLTVNSNDNAYDGNSEIQHLVFSGAVTSIGEYAFGDCPNLRTITIPSSVTTIGDDAFLGCTLTSVTNYATTPQTINNGMFQNMTVPPSYCILYVPSGSKSAYKNKQGWWDLSVTEMAPLQVSEFEVPGSWNGDYYTELTASDFPGFVAASAAEAQAWSGAPASGSSYLIYAFEDGKAKVCEFVDGDFNGLVTESVRDDIYFRFELGYQIYYTGTAPVYTLLSTITMQLENSQFVENHTNPNVASIGKSCNVTYAQYANYIAWKTGPWSSGEMLLVMPKEGYTITKVVFTRDNNPSNKVTVYSAPFTASVTNSDNISKIEVYGEAETPAAPVVVASWESNECAVVLTNDGKLTVSKNEYNGEMEDMNSYQSSKWRCFSDLITSVEIQEGVTRIGDYAFYNLQNVTSVSLPNSLTSIGDGAFMDCSIIGDLVLPENLESIGEKCFSMVPKSLSTISVPASVTSIGMCAFENKGASNKTSTNVLTAINVAAANPNYCSVDGILYSKDMTTLIAYPAGKTNTEYEIPATVTEIKYNALYSCVNITDLTIPAGTSVIEENGGSNIVAFSGCYGLENIHNNATTPQSIYRVLSYWEGQGQDQINLYIPSGTRAAYEAADGWKDLNIIDSTPTPTPTDEQVPTNEDPENPSYHYSTFFHSTQNYKLTNDGTQAFIADLSGSDLVLTKIADGTQVIPANTAVILRKTGSNEPVALAPTTDPGVSFSANNDLEGVDDATPVTDIAGLTLDNCYVLSGTAQYGVGFYKINGNTLKAHKAYVKYVGGPNNAPKKMRFVYDQATDIEEVMGYGLPVTEKRIENGQLFILRDGKTYNAMGQIVK